MTKNNMELAEWGDGTIRLAFWENMHGDDKIFVLGGDGQAFLSRYDEQENSEYKEVLVPINLVLSLRELAKQ